EDLWKHAYPVATELDRLDRLYEYNWNFSNLEEAFDEGGVLHGEKVYLFVCTEAPIERADILIPTVIAVVSPFPPSDKIGLISVQRESESRKVVDMKQMKMDWVPYVPLGKRSALVERLKSQIFVLSCVQRRNYLAERHKRLRTKALASSVHPQLLLSLEAVACHV
ncbi:heat intolerant 4-like protein, partial [Tanacetum coccineum]